MSRTIRKSRRGKIYRDGRSQWKNFPYSTPKWWRKMYMIRPKRYENKRMCKIAMECSTGYEYFPIESFTFWSKYLEFNHEDAVWPLGNNKPHEYYW